jgi:hypothetical protein
MKMESMKKEKMGGVKSGGDGIERLLQRNNKKEGQGGKMNNAPREMAHWKRNDSTMTPRKA